MRLHARTFVATFILIAGVAQASASTVSFENVVFPGTGQPLSVAGSDGTVFTFSAGPASQFQSFQSGGIGSFPAGAFFLGAGLGNSAPISISFSSPLSTVTIPVSTDRVGDSPFTTTVDFLNGSSIVDTFTQSGNTLNPPLTFSSSGLFSGISISTIADAPFGFTQNLGSINYSAAVAVPGPLAGAGIVPLFGLGLIAMRRRRQKLAA